MTLTFGSLFSGIGGMDLGLERAGMRCAWQVEIDDYATRALARHWPDVPRFRDVRECGADSLTPVDVIAGGFPCQPTSVSGLGKAREDERWLWPEFQRLISELRPRYVIVENVPGILARRGMGDVLGGLAACGYDAEWQSLPAAAFGAPHLRERMLLVAYPGRVSGHVEESRARGQERVFPQTLHPTPLRQDNWTADSAGRVAGHLFDRWAKAVGRPAPLALVHGMDDGLSRGMERDRERTLGNAVVPQVAQWIGERIIQHASSPTPAT